MSQIFQFFDRKNVHIKHLNHYHDEYIQKDKEMNLVETTQSKFYSPTLVSDAKRYLELYELKLKLANGIAQNSSIWDNSVSSAVFASINNEMKSLHELMKVTGDKFVKLPK